MAWTAPRTWVTGELVTASLLNTHVRDDLSYLKASPTFDGSVIVAGSITAGSGSVGIVDATGKIPAISSTYFASLSGSNLTNVALLNGVNTFSAANPIILGAASTGTLRTDQAGYLTMQSGSTGFAWRDSGNAGNVMTLTSAGALTVTGTIQSTSTNGWTIGSLAGAARVQHAAGVFSFLNTSNAAADITFGLFSGTTFGTSTLSSGGVGNQALIITNTSSGAANGALFRATAGTTVGQVQAYSQGYTTGSYDVQAAVSLLGNGVGGLSIVASDAAGAIRFYSGGSTLRWGINSAGDFTFGASSHIADSSGTPTCGTNCASVAGQDYAFAVTGSGSGHTTVTVNFGHTFSNTPVCTPTGTALTSNPYYITSVSTSAITIVLGGATQSNEITYVNCRGY
jgi:hypothetical protein